MIRDFDNLPIIEGLQKPRVGIVGEILVKFLPAANNHLADLLEQEGAEAVIPDLTDFLLYCFYDASFKEENLGASKKTRIACDLGIKFFEWLRSAARDEFNKSKRFTAPAYIHNTAEQAKDIVSIGNQTGEGWFLTGEMIELEKCLSLSRPAQVTSSASNHLVVYQIMLLERVLSNESDMNTLMPIL